MKIAIYKKQVISFAIAVFAFVFTHNFAKADTVYTPDLISNGKIKSVNAGMIIIRENGSDLTFKRSVGNDYFEDAVAFKKYFFSRKFSEMAGRVESIDRMNVIVYTQAGKVEIQRYKIKNIIMKVPNRGF